MVLGKIKKKKSTVFMHKAQICSISMALKFTGVGITQEEKV